MTLTITLIAAAAALAAVAVAFGLRSRWVAVRRRKLVRVHVERNDQGDDATIEGILVGRWAGQVVLTRARWIDAEDSSTTLAGDIEIPQGRVLFIQVLGSGA